MKIDSNTGIDSATRNIRKNASHASEYYDRFRYTYVHMSLYIISLNIFLTAVIVLKRLKLVPKLAERVIIAKHVAPMKILQSNQTYRS